MRKRRTDSDGPSLLPRTHRDDWDARLARQEAAIWKSLQQGRRPPTDPMEFASVLKFIETVFDLPALTQRDRVADDMLSSFDFTQSPQPPLVLEPRTCPETPKP